MSSPLPGDDYDTESEPDGGHKVDEKAWRKHTADARDLAASLDSHEATDLSLHLYNTHALKAQQYSSVAAAEAKPWQSKEYWYDESTWRPPQQWTAWPLSIGRAPTQDEAQARRKYLSQDDRVGLLLQYQTSCVDDLEEELLASMLRRAKLQLADETLHDSPLDEIPVEHTNTPPPGQTYAQVAEAHTQDANAISERLTITSDGDNARELLLPAIQTTMVELDRLLLALHESRKGHTLRSNAVRKSLSRAEKGVKSEQSSDNDDTISAIGGESGKEEIRSASESTGDSLRRSSGYKIRRLGTRDWSEVLALASMIGWDQDVVQQTAERCADLFREHMQFRRMPDPIAADKGQVMEDTVLLDSKQRKRKRSGNLYCPFVDCKRAVQEFDIVKRLHEHLRRKHGWTVDECKAHRSQQMEKEANGHHILPSTAGDGLLDQISIDWSLTQRRRFTSK